MSRSKKLYQTELQQWLVPPLRLDDQSAKYLVTEGDISECILDPTVTQEFDKIANMVAEAKNPLDDIPPKEYNRISQELDLYNGLKRHLSGRMPFVTNATLKMHEMLSELDLLGHEVRAFLNAELPGAFVVALQNFVEMMPGSKPNVDWVASSYAPVIKDSGPASKILGDKYGMYSKYRKNWLMGPRPNALPDGVAEVDGDVTNVMTVVLLASAVHTRFGAGATLYTSDAGIDVSDDYNRQEEKTLLLNFGQVICGLFSLAPGGCLITKQYSYFLPASRELIMLVSACFEEVYIVKPVTSRPANSEIYLYGKGFLGMDAKLVKAIIGVFKNKNNNPAAPIFKNKLPTDDHFSSSLRKIDNTLLKTAKEMALLQIAYLEEIMVCYRTMSSNELHKFVHDASNRVIRNWISHNMPVTKGAADSTKVAAPAAIMAAPAADAVASSRVAFKEAPTMMNDMSQLRLTREILHTLQLGTTKWAAAECKNIFERWIMSMVNTRSNAQNQLSVYHVSDIDDFFNQKMVSELVEKRILNQVGAKATVKKILNMVSMTIANITIASASHHVELQDSFLIYYENQAVFRVKIDTDSLKTMLRIGGEVATLAASLRYEVLSTGGQQWGLPRAHVKYLYEAFNVRNEAFASPLNSRLMGMPDAHFCSLFLDTDEVFGSIGNFFSIDNASVISTKGNWIVNPPFVEKILEQAAVKCLEILELQGAKAPVFFYIMPAWVDSNTYNMLHNSKYCAAELRLEPGTYYYETPTDQKIWTRAASIYFALRTAPRATPLQTGIPICQGVVKEDLSDLHSEASLLAALQNLQH